MGTKELKLPLEAIPVLRSSKAESGVDEFPPHEAFVAVVGMLPWMFSLLVLLVPSILGN